MATTYEIGGLCVLMTSEQAARWNSGDTDASDLRKVEVVIPGRVGCGSRLVDGEVIVDDGLPTSRSITLAEALSDPELERMLDGMPANRTS